MSDAHLKLLTKLEELDAYTHTVLHQFPKLERHLLLLGQAVDRNRAAQAAAFAELKRNDKAVADYLAGAVPAALGRLYERPETTDPAAYTAPAGMQPGAVPAAVSPGGVGQ